MMKKIIILIILSLFVSCNKSTQPQAVKYIRSIYPDKDIYVDSSNTRFLVIEENKIVQFYNSDDNGIQMNKFFMKIKLIDEESF